MTHISYRFLITREVSYLANVSSWRCWILQHLLCIYHNLQKKKQKANFMKWSLCPLYCTVVKHGYWTKKIILHYILHKWFKVKGCIQLDCFHNEDIIQELNVTPIIANIDSNRQWRGENWLRIDESWILKIAFKNNPKGRRDAGHPRKRWALWSWNMPKA